MNKRENITIYANKQIIINTTVLHMLSACVVMYLIHFFTALSRGEFSPYDSLWAMIAGLLFGWLFWVGMFTICMITEWLFIQRSGGVRMVYAAFATEIIFSLFYLNWYRGRNEETINWIVLTIMVLGQALRIVYLKQKGYLPHSRKRKDRNKQDILDQ